MIDLIMKEIENSQLDISIVIKDLTNDKWLLKHREGEIYSSASLIKVPIMVEALYQVEKGLYALDEKIRIKPEDRIKYSIVSDLTIDEYPLVDLITLMIIVSDNTATNVLIDLLGFENINKRLKDLNCHNTILQRKMLDFEKAKKGMDNLTSPMDMVLIMEGIYSKSILKPKSCEIMLDILTRQKYRDKLGRYLSEDIVIAHKTGSLTGINHDIGIFLLDNVHYLKGAFTKNGKDDAVGNQVIGRISKIVYDNFLK